MPGVTKLGWRSRSRLLLVLVLVAATITACGESPGIALGEPTIVSQATGVGTAPMFAVSPSGVRAVAWVSAPNGGTDGRLYLSVDGRAPVEIRDSLGPIAAHGESPPQLAFGSDGALNALYVVGRVRPDRRFPLGALRFVRSTDGGATWTAPATVTDDSVFGSHNFHALHAGADGTLYASWLDGRAGRAGAYLASSTDGGATWLPNRPVASGEACPCCRTAIATAADGTLYLAWRMVSPDSIRDIVVARSSDHGATWSTPTAVHADKWVFNACPHAGPSLAVDSAGTLHVAWWTGRDGIAGVYYAQSRDGARSFSDPVPLQAPGLARP
ncbi:MAG TPA: sialidase family protein, partial [Gemmatimonadales bacterium]|nr:sialidase family protein [Gemmatimonadales bacterium]